MRTASTTAGMLLASAFVVADAVQATTPPSRSASQPNQSQTTPGQTPPGNWRVWTITPTTAAPTPKSAKPFPFPALAVKQLPQQAQAETPKERSAEVVSRIRTDAVAARQRQANMRFLGGIDHRYWPEAQEVLISALRSDPNESVRIEAAAALGRGYYCTKPCLRALTITINVSEEDGHPAEASTRVREVAQRSLNYYVNNFSSFLASNLPLFPLSSAPNQPTLLTTKYRSDRPNESLSIPNAFLSTTYYEQVNSLDWQTVLDDARKVLPHSGTAHPPSTISWKWPRLNLAEAIRPVASSRHALASAQPPETSNPAPPSPSKEPGLLPWWKNREQPRTIPNTTTEEPPLAEPLESVASITNKPRTASDSPSTYSPIAPAVHTVPKPTPASPPAPVRTVEIQPKERMLNFFINAAEPGYREWAAYQLADIVDAHRDERLMRALRHAAEQDPDPLVRLACSRSLLKLQEKSEASSPPKP